MVQRNDSDEYQPTHYAVKRHRKAFYHFVVHRYRVAHHAENRHRPLHREDNRPQERTAKRNEAKRRVSARNQQKYRAMVEYAEYGLCFAAAQEVIQRAHRVQKYHGNAEHRHCDRRRHGGVRQRYTREENCDPDCAAHDMRDGVENLFAFGVQRRIFFAALYGAAAVDGLFHNYSPLREGQPRALFWLDYTHKAAQSKSILLRGDYTLKKSL